MTKYFYHKTGMYDDWGQIEKLPDIDTLIDIGVGPMGTPDLYERFCSAKLLLIDPLDETEDYIAKNLLSREVKVSVVVLGKKSLNKLSMSKKRSEGLLFWRLLILIMKVSRKIDVKFK